MRVSVKKLSNDATGGRVKAAEAWLTVWGSFGVSGCDIFSFWAVKSEALEAVASGFVCSPLHPPSLIMSSLHCFIIICLFGLNCSQLKPPYTSCKELQFFQSFFPKKSQDVRADLSDVSLMRFSVLNAAFLAHFAQFCLFF